MMIIFTTRNFYENFTGLSGDTLEKVSTEGFRSMTAVSNMMTIMMIVKIMMMTVMIMIMIVMIMMIMIMIFEILE